MTVVAGFENVDTDSAEALILNDTTVMSAILVGPRDFILRGKKSEIVHWLSTFNKPIKTCKGYGNHVNIILSIKSTTLSDQQLSDVCNTVGLRRVAISSEKQIPASDSIGSDTTLTITITQPRLQTNSAFTKDVKKLHTPLNKDVEIRFSAAKDIYHTGSSYKRTKLSVVRIESNFTSRYTAGIVSLMQ